MASGDLATLIVCPTRTEVLTVLHVNHRMKRLHGCETLQAAERKARAIRDELVSLDLAS